MTRKPAFLAWRWVLALSGVLMIGAGTLLSRASARDIQGPWLTVAGLLVFCVGATWIDMSRRR